MAAKADIGEGAEEDPEAILRPPDLLDEDNLAGCRAEKRGRDRRMARQKKNGSYR
jgi:hypothetical protein